jgi:putative addiction module component (TIGR02574 family)
MPKPLDEVEQDALALPAKDRAELAQDLLATLDPGDDADVEEAWIAEAERRYQEYRSGKVKLIPADEALQRARRDVRS